MKQSDVYTFLAASRDLDLVVKFHDGDSYPIRKLDLCNLELQEIRVSFKDCLRQSTAWEIALRTEPMEAVGVWWTSEPPIEPVGTTYTADDVACISDVGRGFNVYETES
ncbi:MAG: hypothetical protein QNJ00_13805 [Woeseiaceae bacterium]|nr:hypothetical protein [Woeseiaceae bacterium]